MTATGPTEAAARRLAELRDLPALLKLLIGLAAVLFSPAVESEVARQAVRYEREGHPSRSGIMALFSVAGQIGTLTGPLLGALLLAGLVVLLTVGQMLIVPAARSWLPDLTEQRHLGLYTGALSSISALLVLIGNTLVGLTLDHAGDTPLPWLLLAAPPVAGAVLLVTARSDRRSPGRSKASEERRDADPGVVTAGTTGLADPSPGIQSRTSLGRTAAPRPRAERTTSRRRSRPRP